MWELIMAAWVALSFPLGVLTGKWISKGGGAMRDDVCWDAKWQEIEEWADDADKD